MIINGDFPQKFNITVRCASGVEKVLKSELFRLGYGDLPAINGGITFQGDILDVARCNVNLRTADRVYISVCEFNALTFDELFDGVYSINWGDYLPKNAKIVVNGNCVKSQLFAISACQSIVKKAIINKLSKIYNCNTFIEDGSQYKIDFYIYKNNVSILIDTSGAGLHKRGYRDLVGIAPIKETLASSLLLMSDFYYKNPFADVFCGSGTFAIEGVKIALNIAPNLNRKFDFNNWINFDNSKYNLAIEEAIDKEKRDRKIEFFASDIDPKAIKLAKRHAMRAGVDDRINFLVRDVGAFSTNLKNGTIVTNPPYGERVYDKKEADECAKKLGKIKDTYKDWSIFAISSAKNFEKMFGRKADRERKMFNSEKECRFYYYYGKKEKNNGWRKIAYRKIT